MNYDNCDLSCILALGVLCAGGALCYLGLKDPHSELMYVARKVEPKFYAGHRDRMHKAERIEEELGYKMVKINMDSEEGSENQFDLHFLLGYDHKTSKQASKLPLKYGADDVAFITMSSGTTGLPKAIAATQKNIIAESLYFVGKNYHNIRIPSPSPLDYVSGRLVTMGATLIGFRAVILNGFEPKTYLEAIEKEKTQVIILGAASFHSLITDEHLSKYDISSVRGIFPMGAKIVYVNELKKFCRDHPNIVMIRNGYGSSECSGISSHGNHPSKFFDDIDNLGQLRPGVQVKIVDTETNQLLGPNQKGMILVKSRSVFPGYYDMQLARQRATNDSDIWPIIRDSSIFDPDGFYITGDIGWIDDNENLFLEGRYIEVMSCMGAKKVLPHELEVLIQEHPAVLKVCVLGIKSKIDILCDCPRAFIVPKAKYYDPNIKDSELELAEHIEESDVEPYQMGTYKGTNKLCKLSDQRRHLIVEDIDAYVNERVSVEKRLVGGIILLDSIPILRTTGKMNKPYLRSLTTNEVEIYGDRSEIDQ